MTPKSAGSFRAQPDDSIARVLEGWKATRPELAVEPIAITARLARLHAVMGPKLERVFAEAGLRGADFAVLATLIRLDMVHVSQKRLAAELGLSAGTLSVRVDRLVSRGLIARLPDPDDGRGALVSLTSEGRSQFEACAPAHLANAGELVAGLTERERVQLGRLLGKLLSTLEGV